MRDAALLVGLGSYDLELGARQALQSVTRLVLFAVAVAVDRLV
jgi:hypothetical protein